MDPSIGFTKYSSGLLLLIYDQSALYLEIDHFVD